MTTQSLAGKTRAKFLLKGDKGKNVFVAGTFNSWDPKKNKMKFEDGIYRTSVLVAKGRHEYKFVVDGVWSIDPECEDWVTNEYGSLNSVLIVM